MRRRLRALFALVVSIVIASTMTSAAETKIKVVTFAGATNIAVWAGNERGFFANEGLSVTHEITRGSTSAMQGLMDGSFQFVSAALDNTIAIKEGQGDVNFPDFDVVAILGVHSGMNKVISRPEVKSFADIRGKAIASDALNSGYGLVLVKILAANGLAVGRDYQGLAVGSTPNRIQALKDGRAAAAMISPPEHLNLVREGFNLLGDATEAIGAYQGSAFVVRQSWAKANEATVLAFIRAQVAATAWVFADKEGAVALLRKNLKGLSDSEIESAYDAMVTSKGGLNRGAKLNMAGVRTLLDLRNELAGSDKKLTDPTRYVDLTWYDKATGGK